MSDFSIRAERLSKQYDIGRLQAANGYPTLRERLADGCAAPFRRAARLIRGRWSVSEVAETMWALSDVSFEIRQGEVVGIIGRNGAGKSTLLKILARVTDPTTGHADVRGRIGSLLEVGSGFHPELTGRENAFLYGAILGMRRVEIRRKFDEIVAFAEVEKFIDTPVKHYSSGMYLRLAFAVAAHLEPEILLVDEVLAVGDSRFQKKCLGKMNDVAQHGRTVLFVSHNMPAVTRLCPRTILLDQGRVVQDGPSAAVVAAYVRDGAGTSAERTWSEQHAPGTSIARLRAARVRAADGTRREAVDIREPIWIEMQFDVLEPGHLLMPNFQFYTEEGVHAFSAHDMDAEWRGKPRPVGRYTCTARVPGNFLSEGAMFIGVGLMRLAPEVIEFYELDVLACQVIDSAEGDCARGDWGGPMGGAVRPILEWATLFEPEEARRAAPHLADGYSLPEVTRAEGLIPSATG